jgi:hypothetical protein
LSESNGTKSFTIQLWHIGLLLVVQLAGIAAGYGAIRQQVIDNDERVSHIENSSIVSRDEFRAFQADVLQRLDRLQQEVSDQRILAGR